MSEEEDTSRRGSKLPKPVASLSEYDLAAPGAHIAEEPTGSPAQVGADRPKQETPQEPSTTPTVGGAEAGDIQLKRLKLRLYAEYVRAGLGLLLFLFGVYLLWRVVSDGQAWFSTETARLEAAAAKTESEGLVNVMHTTIIARALVVASILGVTVGLFRAGRLLLNPAEPGEKEEAASKSDATVSSLADAVKLLAKRVSGG